VAVLKSKIVKQIKCNYVYVLQTRSHINRKHGIDNKIYLKLQYVVQPYLSLTHFTCQVKYKYYTIYVEGLSIVLWLSFSGTLKVLDL